MKNISIVIPTLNEARNISPLLDRIFHSTCNSDYCPEILIVDDGSTDDTRQQVLNYKKELSVQLICRDNQRGLASAVIAGARQASSEIIVVMDADHSHPPEIIPSLIAPLEDGSHDMVIGSRYVKGGETPDWPAARRLCSQLASIPARLLTSIDDPLAGFFAVKKELLTVIDSQTPGFKIGLEILASHTLPISSSRVLEVPISFADRNEGVSKMDHKVIISYLRQLFRLSFSQLADNYIPFLLLLGLVVGLLDYSILSFITDQHFTIEEGHIFSLLLSTHFNYPLLIAVTRSNSTWPQYLHRYLQFLTVILFGLFLRGGILSWTDLTQQNEFQQLFLYVALFTVGILSWLTATLISRNERLTTGANSVAISVLLVGYTILLRLIYLGGPELLQEEAYYWNYSQHLSPGYLDHPPIVALLIKFGTLLFGHNEFGVRIGAFGCWFITAFFTFKLTKIIFDRGAAFRTLLLVATLPIFFCVGLVITPDAPLIASWAGAIYFLYNALIRERKNSWFGAGICLGIGLASKYTIAFLGPAVVLFMLVDPNSRNWFFRPQPYLAAILALTIFSPVIWWNYQHDWASFLFQSQARLQASSEFSTLELLGSILLLITPIGFLAAIASLRPKFIRNYFQQKTSSTSMGRSHLFSLTMTMVPLSIFALFSLTKEIKLNWTGPIWLAVLPFIAFAMAHYDDLFQARLNRIWPRTIILSTLLLGGLLHYMAIGLPGIPFSQRDLLFGYDSLAQQIDAELIRMKDTDDRIPIVVGYGKYRLASGLAFYRRKHLKEDPVQHHIDDTTGSQLLGYSSLMYDYWLPPEKATGRDYLVVSENPRGLRPVSFREDDPRLGDIHTFKVTKRAKEAGDFYYRLISNTPPMETGKKTVASNQKP